MRVELIHITGTGLNDSIKKSYQAGIASVARMNKNNILKFNDEPPRNLFTVDYSLRDLQALQNFRVEAFTVASVGVYELEEKLKDLAMEIQKEDSMTDPFKEFEKRSREIMNQYVWNDKQPPSGWLATNLQTAVTSSYRAAEWIRITNPDLLGIYSYLQYMTVGDDRVRPAHRLLHKQIFATTDQIWDTIYPPNGWNCRCYVNPMTNDEVPGDTPGHIDEQERAKYIEQADVHPDFARNSGQTKSIWDKWLNSKLNEVDTNTIIARMQEYADSHKSISNYILTAEQISAIRNALGSGQYKQHKDYDDNKYLSIEDNEIRKSLDPVFKDPDEVWGDRFKTNDGIGSKLYYIKYAKEGIIVSIVSNGKVTEVRDVEIKNINNYRKGTLIHKNFK